MSEFNPVTRSSEETPNDATDVVEKKKENLKTWFVKNQKTIMLAVIVVQTLLLLGTGNEISECKQHIDDAIISSRSVSELLGFGYTK